MSTTNYKVSQAQINARHVQAAADELTGTTAQNKAVFDNLPEYIAEVYNTLCDYLEDKVVSEQVCGSGISFGSDGKLFWSFSLQEGDEIMSNTLSPEFGDRMLIRSAPPTRSQMDNVYVIITKGEDSNTFLTGSTYDYGSGYASDYEEKFRIETDNGGTYLNVLDETFFNTYMGGEVTVTLNESFAEMRVPAKCINISEAVLPSGSGGVIVRPTEPIGDETFVWVDTSEDPAVGKYYDGTEWTPLSPTKPAIITSDMAPAGDSEKLWIDTSTSAPVCKYWNGEAWIPTYSPNAAAAFKLTIDVNNWEDSTVRFLDDGTPYKENFIEYANPPYNAIIDATSETEGGIATEAQLTAFYQVVQTEGVFTEPTGIRFLARTSPEATFYVSVLSVPTEVGG